MMCVRSLSDSADQQAATALPPTYTITLFNLQSKKSFLLTRRGVDPETIGPETEITIEDGDQVKLGGDLIPVTLTFHWRPLALAMMLRPGNKHRDETDELLRSTREWLGAIGGRISTTSSVAQPAPATTHLAVCSTFTTCPAIVACSLRAIPLGSGAWLQALKTATHMPELVEGDGQVAPSDPRMPGQGFSPLELDWRGAWPDPAQVGNLAAIMKGDVASMSLTDTVRWQPMPERKQLFTNMLVAFPRPPGDDQQGLARVDVRRAGDPGETDHADPRPAHHRAEGPLRLVRRRRRGGRGSRPAQSG